MVNIEHLCFSYNGIQPGVLNDINLKIEAGEYVSIIGDNGSGKTTLMRIMLGFLKPTAGSMSIETKEIGYVPQKSDYANSAFPVTVFEVLDSYRKIMKIKDRTVVMRALALVGMSDYRKELMGTLSGGQTQKILIARALMGNPKLLILDEPSTGVDIDSQKEIYRLLKKMENETGMTIVAVEHNFEAVFENSTKLYHLQNGCGHFCNIEKYASEYLHYDRKG
ncbi:metal ABC transporter ATP-binding protein [Anaerobium acetethylicum]|uniref:Zinc transport system ATP-binding protein n=1 Tax=Anaerobium acetethylicum TaxID=1619234 RepID=A0A1D3TPD6_9FIRM|nr:metal ABC transporter ATP-binding protein [Anaerobium acetethylicum]SCP95275.1 zinc transport system ATP-binding protein [Anaerobium acetethylicum]